MEKEIKVGSKVRVERANGSVALGVVVEDFGAIVFDISRGQNRRVDRRYLVRTLTNKIIQVKYSEVKAR